MEQTAVNGLEFILMQIDDPYHVRWRNQKEAEQADLDASVIYGTPLRERFVQIKHDVMYCTGNIRLWKTWWMEGARGRYALKAVRARDEDDDIQTSHLKQGRITHPYTGTWRAK